MFAQSKDMPTVFKLLLCTWDGEEGWTALLKSIFCSSRVHSYITSLKYICSQMEPCDCVAMDAGQE
jgi:hypothetical protein